MNQAAADITALLREWSNGSEEVEEALFAELYPHLRAVAANRLMKEGPAASLQVTELVHETFLKLVDQRRVSWHSRVHFLAISAQVMRRLLVDRYRRRASAKRGNQPRRLALEQVYLATSEPEVDVLALHHALHRLEEAHPGAAQLVELRYFGGMTVEEAATFLRISRSTVVRRWQFARIWLKKALEPNPADSAPDEPLTPSYV